MSSESQDGGQRPMCRAETLTYSVVRFLTEPQASQAGGGDRNQAPAGRGPGGPGHAGGGDRLSR